MVVLSTLGRRLFCNLGRKPIPIMGILARRPMGGHHGPRKMVIEPSSYQFLKCINMIHTYSCLAIGVLGGLVLYCNVFIGDAELREIPEGYVPKYWEYYSHPITRWIAWFQGDPQKFYENFLHQLYHEHWDMVYTQLEKKIKFEIKKHKDYKAYYYQAISANALRTYVENEDHLLERFADNPTTHAFPLDFKDDGDWPDSGRS